MRAMGTRQDSCLVLRESFHSDYSRLVLNQQFERLGRRGHHPFPNRQVYQASPQQPVLRYLPKSSTAYLSVAEVVRESRFFRPPFRRAEEERAHYRWRIPSKELRPTLFVATVLSQRRYSERQLRSASREARH